MCDRTSPTLRAGRVVSATTVTVTSAVAGRDRGSGTAGALGCCGSSSSAPRHSPSCSFCASCPLASCTLVSSAANAERSNGCKARPRSDCGTATWAKRSSKDSSSCAIGEETGDVNENDSLIQAAAPQAQASAPHSSATLSDHPMRRRGGERPAIAVSNVIPSPIPPSEGTHPPGRSLRPAEAVYERRNCGIF